MADRQVPTTTGAGIPKSVIVAIAGLVLLATGVIVGVVLHKSPTEETELPTVVAAAHEPRSPDPASEAPAADQATSGNDETHKPDEAVPDGLATMVDEPRLERSTELRIYDPVAHDLIIYRATLLREYAPHLLRLRTEVIAARAEDVDRFFEEAAAWHDKLAGMVQRHTPFTASLGAQHSRLGVYAISGSLACRKRQEPLYDFMHEWYDGIMSLARAHNVDLRPGGAARDLADLDEATLLSRAAAVKIPPRLAWAFDFSEGLAVVEAERPDHDSERRFGYINRNVEAAFPATFGAASRFENGVAAVRRSREGLWGLIDKTGEYILRPEFYSPPVLNDNGIIKIGIKCTTARPFGTPALMDEQGRIIPLPGFDYMGVGQFNEGLAYACRDVDECQDNCGYIDRLGQVRIPVQYEMADDFSGGLAAVQINGKWGYINKEGKLVIQARFGEARPFSEGLAAVAVEDAFGPWGFIDRAGRFVIEPTFARAGTFSDGRAMVGVDTGASASDGYSYGFIDGDGKIVIEPQFDYVNDFSEGYAAVLQGDAWGFIGTSGNLVVRPQFKEVGDCHEGMAWFVVGDGYGYIRFAE